MLSVVISQNNWKLSHRDSSDMLNATNCKLTYQTKRLNQSIWFISVNEWLVVAYSITDNFKLSNCIVISLHPFWVVQLKELCQISQNIFFLSIIRPHALSRDRSTVPPISLILKNFWLFAQDCHNIVGTALRATMSPVALQGRMEKPLIEGGEQTLPPEWPLLHQWVFPAHQSCAKPPCLKCDNLARSPLV